MRDNFNLLTVQSAIGYTFKDTSIIKTAFIHRSFDGKESNVKLVFLGERLVSFLVADYLLSHGSDIGEKQLKASFDDYLEALKPEEYIKKHSLTDMVMLSPLNEALRESKTVCTELFFAICAAIYRDGGLPSLKGFLMPMMRSLGEREKYAPRDNGSVISTDEKAVDTDKHIKSARVKPAKNSIGVSKAETVSVSTEPKPQKSDSSKKDGALSRLLKRKDKKQENSAEKSDKKTEEKIDEQPKKRFIRDALEPVRLSDDLRNFKPKKPAKVYEKSEGAEQKKPDVAGREPTFKEDNGVNYKSLLQEFVQKNVRTANVMLKYLSTPNGKFEWRAEVLLMDKIIGYGVADSKKNAEKAAAEAAYKALTSKNGTVYDWFLSLGDGAQISAPTMDYVSKINQYFQKTQHLSSAPVIYERRNSKKKGVFTVAVMYEGKEIAVGHGKAPKEAKQNAAMNACKALGIK